VGQAISDAAGTQVVEGRLALFRCANEAGKEQGVIYALDLVSS
jgi:hypothetical protein